MKRRTQQFIAAFAIALTVILALCGFIAVDLSTERYMPSEHGPLFQLSGVGSEGVRFSALGQRHRVDSGRIDRLCETLWRFRGLLPRGVLEAGTATAKGYLAARGYLQSRQPQEEPW